MFVPSKHIHPICQSCILCLEVIDLTETSRSGSLYLHGWEGSEASHQGDRWRPADGMPVNATFIIVIPVAAHPLIMSDSPPLSLLSLFFFPSSLFSLFWTQYDTLAEWLFVAVFALLDLAEVMSYTNLLSKLSLGGDNLVKWVACHAVCLCVCVSVHRFPLTVWYLAVYPVCLLYVCIYVVVAAGFDGWEPSTDHSYQSQVHHHGPAVWSVWPCLSRVVRRHPSRQLQILRFLPGKIAEYVRKQQFNVFLGDLIYLHGDATPPAEWRHTTRWLT